MAGHFLCGQERMCMRVGTDINKESPPIIGIGPSVFTGSLVLKKEIVNILSTSAYCISVISFSFLLNVV